MNGWVRLYVQSTDNEIWQRDRVAWQLFEYLLFRAYSDKTQPLGKLVTTRQQMAQACFGNSSTIYKALKRLEKAKMVTTSVTAKYTLVSICKWEAYQSNGNSLGNNKVTTKEQQSNSLRKTKDIRIKNKERKKVISKDITVDNRNSEITKLIQHFETKVGKPSRDQTFAAIQLLNQHGFEKSIGAINLVASSRADRFAPSIGSLVDLEEKWLNLETYFARKITQPKGMYVAK